MNQDEVINFILIHFYFQSLAELTALSPSTGSCADAQRSLYPKFWFYEYLLLQYASDYNILWHYFNREYAVLVG